MHLLVLGGTGTAGRLLVNQTLAAGHSVRALVRSPDKLAEVDSRLEVVIGQATSQEDVKSALSEVDVVISTLGSNTGTVVTDATRAIAAGAAANRVKRVVMLSSFAVLNDQLSFPAKLMARQTLSSMVRDKIAAEHVLRASDLDWTLVHAVRLSNGPATGRPRVLPDGRGIGLKTSISQPDVVTWLLDSATSGTFVRCEIVLGA